MLRGAPEEGNQKGVSQALVQVRQAPSQAERGGGDEISQISQAGWWEGAKRD